MPWGTEGNPNLCFVDNEASSYGGWVNRINLYRKDCEKVLQNKQKHLHEDSGEDNNENNLLLKPVENYIYRLKENIAYRSII